MRLPRTLRYCFPEIIPNIDQSIPSAEDMMMHGLPFAGYVLIEKCLEDNNRISRYANMATKSIAVQIPSPLVASQPVDILAR